ncbi:hypothetical protein ABL78_1916 [Leptomonas seymouri]|uniref:Uncharacterized protein n=1 Tax=Leptomonas seymouri TaxID=5684 RepID=A0A0N1I6R0_LEPSE|nr:hypothetical protein ABL78_1916 [Leptomonas seymouri]|eukprot:KPI88950.1 hypothetical protein ABL78_1916 [Leptomonas seymouri]
MVTLVPPFRPTPEFRTLDGGKRPRDRGSCSSPQSTESDAEHFSCLVGDLSKLLAEPQRYPVILVLGSSSSSAAQLYRLLPIAAFHAYALHGNSASDAESKEWIKAAGKASAIRPSVVRLVTHEAAVHTPKVCAERQAFVDVLHTFCNSGLLPQEDSKGAGEDREHDVVASRQTSLWTATLAADIREASTQAYTEQFLKQLKNDSFFRVESQETPSPSGENRAGATKSTNAGQASQLVDNEGFATVGNGAIQHMEEHVHWVVPLWVGVCASDLRKVMGAWRSVFTGRFKYETATLVLFLSPDVAAGWLGNEARADAFPGYSFEEASRVFSTNPFSPCAAYWREFPGASPLSSALQWMARDSPLFHKLCEETQVECVSNATKEASALQARRCAPGTVRQRSSQSLPCIRLPCLLCRSQMSSNFSFRWPLLEGILRYARELKTSVYRYEGCCHDNSKQPQRTLHRYSLPIPPSFPSWRWLLPCRATRAQVPPLAPLAPPSPYSTADAAAPVFPYILVSDAAAQEAELKLAVRRNAVNAATLNCMIAADRVSNVAANRTDGCPLPKPRYYAPFVADGGSPLTVDGCLSDIFVLEFMPGCVKGKELKSWKCWLHNLQPKLNVGKHWMGRYRASLCLIEATEEFMATPLPSRAVTKAFLQAVQGLLSHSGKGRGVMSWPLLDPREGHRHPRVAFAMTYEFFSNPLMRVDSVTEGGRVAASGVESHPYSSASETCANANTEFPITTFASDRVGSGGPCSSSPVKYAPRAALLKSYDFSFAYSLSALLAELKSFGWVLVWQEDHRRWPTAVAPPCMSENSTAFSHYFKDADQGTAVGSASGEEVATARGLSVSSKVLRHRVASVLEEWRQDQQRRYNARYDVDPATRSCRLGSASPALDCALARDAASLSLERGLHSPLFPSQYTSLDVWQASIVPEDAGMYLWEGQTVLLDDGRFGTIVGFRPPSSKLFVPWASQPTEEKRHLWRVQQQRHADFIRFYRWRRRLHDCNPSPCHHLTAAFTSLPSYVTQREQDLYPLVRVSSRAWAGNSGDTSENRHHTCSLSPPPSASAAAPSRDRLVHVLPTRVNAFPVNYPSVCVATAQEQKRWYDLHPHATSPAQLLHDVAWNLTMTSHRHLKQVTLLSLPLSPHRVETSASFFIAQVFNVSRHPVRCWRLPPLITKDLAPRDVCAVECLSEQWARLHGRTRQGKGMFSPRASPFFRSPQGASFGFIRWASFLRMPRV